MLSLKEKYNNLVIQKINWYYEYTVNFELQRSGK